MSQKASYFLTIPSIPGESKHPNFRGAIELLSWSYHTYGHGSGSVGAGAAGGGIGASIQDIMIVAEPSSASPDLALHCTTGKHIPGLVKLSSLVGNHEQLRATMTDVIVASYSVTPALLKSERTFETIGLNFAKIEYEYFPRPTP